MTLKLLSTLGQQHGLIALPFDYSATLRWTNCSGTAGTTYYIGDGDANTDSIVSNCSTSTPLYAALMAQNNTSYGYTDWFLPSINELGKLLTNRTNAGLTMTGNYWSSSMVGTTNAYYAGPSGNSFGSNYTVTSVLLKVRIIRKF